MCVWGVGGGGGGGGGVSLSPLSTEGIMQQLVCVCVRGCVV